MEITLANFQLQAIADLIESMENQCKEIVLKSCTGSGKTIILAHFMDEYIRGNAATVFVWLTPGKGNLRWTDTFTAATLNYCMILWQADLKKTMSALSIGKNLLRKAILP